MLAGSRAAASAAAAFGLATGERSSYSPLAGLLNAVGATLKPKAFCVQELADQGAGHPDFGLYAARQVQRGQPREGQTRGRIPDRGGEGGASEPGRGTSGPEKVHERREIEMET